MKKLYILIFTLLLCVNVYADKKPENSTVNASGVPINSATEEKQDTIIVDTGIIAGDTTSMDGKMPSDPSTVTEQNQTQTAINAVETNQTDATQKTQLVDGSGNVISSLGNALDIHNADVHIELINRHFIDFDTNTEAISSVSAGDTVLLVASTTGFVDGDHVVLKDSGGDVREHHFEVIAIVADTSIELDTPVAIAYATGIMEEVIINQAVDGSGATLIYEVIPPSDEIWHITRLLISITDGTDMDDSEFGGLGTALEYGVVIRENKNSGTYRTLTNWKINGHMTEDMYDVTYVDRSLPAGSFGLRGRWTFKNADVIVKLDGSTGDKIEILIQDDLTDLLTFRIKAQGHKEGL